MSRKPREPIRTIKPTLREASFTIARPAAPARSGEVKRERGRKRFDRKARMFGRFPLCAIHYARAETEPAVWLDHRHALVDGGPDTEANCWGLCDECHKHKTAEEAQRRARGGDRSTPLEWLPPRPREYDL